MATPFSSSAQSTLGQGVLPTRRSPTRHEHLCPHSFLTKYLYIFLILLTTYISLKKYLSYFFTSYKSHFSPSTTHIFPIYIFHTYYKIRIPKLTNYISLKVPNIFILYLTNLFPTKYLYILPIHITNTVSHKTHTHTHTHTYIFLNISIHLQKYQTLL